MKKRINVVLGNKILELIEQRKQPMRLLGDDGFSYLWDGDTQTYIIEGTSIGITAYDLATGTFSYETPILDDAEKRYLRGVVRPFRDRVDMIQKIKSTLDGFEHIKMYVRYPGSSSIQSSLMLPAFESGTMYVGMKLEKDYTLSELEL